MGTSISDTAPLSGVPVGQKTRPDCGTRGTGLPAPMGNICSRYYYRSAGVQYAELDNISSFCHADSYTG